MRVRAVDEENDWTFGKGRSNYKYDINALAQNVKCRLQCYLGDNFFNLSGGLDWFNLIGSKNILRLRLEVTTCILNTYGVLGVTSFNISINEDREFSIQYSIDTIYGELNNQNLEVPSA